MNKRLIIIFDSFTRNTATANRLLAMVRGFSELDVEIELVFVQPNFKLEKVPFTYPRVTMRYLWEGHPSKNQLIKRIRGFYDIYNYAKTLRPNDKVLIIGAGQYLPLLLNRKDVSIFHERSEHPFVVKVIPHFLQGTYLNSCSKLSGMFVISKKLKEFYESIGVSNVNIINMIVDSNRFLNIQKTENCYKYIAYCGKATNNKDGVNELIKAFSLISAKHKDLKLMIIGQAPKNKDKLSNLKLVKKMDLTEKVIFTGSTAASKIPQLLKDAIACVLDRPESLQAQSGFPTKLGEYLLSGNPVVVTKVGDIPLFLNHKVNALLANTNDAKDFAQQVCWILDHPEEAKVIGKEGQSLALKEFNYKTECKKMADIIFST